MGDNLMLKINLIVMGDIKEKYFKEAIEEYKKRISRFAELKIIRCYINKKNKQKLY